MPSSLRDRRIEQEWLLLNELAAANRGLVEVLHRRKLADSEDFGVRLHNTEGILADDETDTRVSSHNVRLSFPRFYPAAPLEAYLSHPVRHPNVDPRNGFVCLWTKYGVRETVVEALSRLQEMITWQRMNLDVEHVMQPEAVDWHSAARKNGSDLFPFSCQPIQELHDFRLEKERFRPQGRIRRRLEPF